MLGNGTMLASVSVTHGTPELIERCSRAHPLFASRATPVAISAPAATAKSPAALSTQLIADELRKLADLKSEGVLSEAEFLEQKQRLLGS